MWHNEFSIDILVQILLDSTHLMFFTTVNVWFFRLCLSSYKYALWLHCRHRRDVSSGCEQRCPNWQRRRLRLALHLLAGITTFAQNAASGSERQVLFSVTHSHLCVLELPSVWHKICIHVYNPLECRSLHQMSQEHASWDDRTCSLLLDLINKQKDLCH